MTLNVVAAHVDLRRHRQPGSQPLEAGLALVDRLRTGTRCTVFVKFPVVMVPFAKPRAAAAVPVAEH